VLPTLRRCALPASHQAVRRRTILGKTGALFYLFCALLYSLSALFSSPALSPLLKDLPDVSKEKMASFNSNAIDTKTQRYVSKDRRLLERVIKKCIANNIPTWDTMPPTLADMSAPLKIAITCALQIPGLEFSKAQAETKWHYRLSNRRKSLRAKQRRLELGCNDDTTDDDDDQGDDDGAGVWQLCGFVGALFICFVHYLTFCCAARGEPTNPRRPRKFR
jgi:hypothetical protein